MPEARVLVLYTGGTVGMRCKNNGGMPFFNTRYFSKKFYFYFIKLTGSLPLEKIKTESNESN